MLLVIRVLVQVRIASPPPPFLFKDSAETDMLHGFGNYDCCSYTIYSSLKLVRLMDAGYMVCVTIKVQNACYTIIVNELVNFFFVKYEYKSSF